MAKSPKEVEQFHNQIFRERATTIIDITHKKDISIIDRLKQTPPETWIENEQVLDPATHPLVSPPLKPTAMLYDLQRRRVLYKEFVYFHLEGQLMEQ